MIVRPRKFRTTNARRRERVRRTVLSFVGVFLLILLLVGLFFGLRHPLLRIQEVTVTTDGSIDVAQIEAGVLREISGSYAFLVPKDIGVFVDTGYIEGRLKGTFPRIADIRLLREGMHALVGTVRERTPRVLWCGDIVPPMAEQGRGMQGESESQGVCYLVDETGYIYDVAPQYSGSPFIRFYSSLERATPVGQYTTQGEVFTSVLDFLHKLEVPHQNVHSVLLVDERDVEVYFDSGVRILVQHPLGSMAHVPINILFTSEALDATRVLEQIDVRFGNKVFVKYQDGEDERVLDGAVTNQESTPLPVGE